MGGVKTCRKQQGVGESLSGEQQSTSAQYCPWVSRGSDPMPSLSVVTAVWQC